MRSFFFFELITLRLLYSERRVVQQWRRLKDGLKDLCLGIHRSVNWIKWQTYRNQFIERCTNFLGRITHWGYKRQNVYLPPDKNKKRKSKDPLDYLLKFLSDVITCCSNLDSIRITDLGLDHFIPISWLLQLYPWVAPMKIGCILAGIRIVVELIMLYRNLSSKKN